MTLHDVNDFNNWSREDYKVSYKPSGKSGKKTKSVDLYYLFHGGTRLLNAKKQTKIDFEGMPNLAAYILHYTKARYQYSSVLDIRAWAESLFYVLNVNKRVDNLSSIDQQIINEHGRLLLDKCVPSSAVAAASLGNGFLAWISNLEHRQHPNLLDRKNYPISYPKIERSGRKRVKYISVEANDFIFDVAQAYLTLLDKRKIHLTQSENGTDYTNLAHVKWHLEQFVLNNWFSPSRHISVLGPSVKNYEAIGLSKLGHADSALNQNQLTLANAVRSLFPENIEMGATAVLIANDTAWIDTINAIDITTSWYSRELDSDQRVTSNERIHLYARRPKTFGTRLHPHAALSSGKYGSAWWALDRYLKRSDLLRAAVERRLNENEGLVATDTGYASEVKDLALISSSVGLQGSSSEAVTAFISKIRQWIQTPEKGTDDLFLEAINKVHRSYQNIDLADVKTFNFKDIRDVVALKTLVATNGDIVEVQRKLRHKNIQTTLQYLKTDVLRKGLFEQFARTTGIVYNEIKRGFEVDMDVLYVRFQKDGEDLSSDERKKLGSLTSAGAFCKDIKSPPPNISSSKGRCTSHSCILCPNAIFVPQEEGAIELFAQHHAERQIQANNLPPTKLENTKLFAELEVIKLKKDELFKDRIAEYEKIYKEHFQKLDKVGLVA